MSVGIYVITHRSSGRKYVGQSRNVERRLKQHQRARGGCRKLHEAICRFGWEAFDVRVIDVTACKFTQEDLDREEREFINACGSLGAGGFNLQRGGIAGKATDETRERLAQAARERWADKDFRERMLEAHKCHHRAVVQLDQENGNVLARFDTIKEAAESAGLRASNITVACQGVVQTSGGFVWRYADEDRPFVAPSNSRHRAVVQLDKATGAVLARFSTIKEAAEVTGAHGASLAQACRGKRKASGGFAWRYAEDEGDVVIPPDSRLRAVVQIDRSSCAVLAEYPTIREAAKATGADFSSISHVCRGKLNTAGGFIWRYADEEVAPVAPVKARHRAVVQIDQTTGAVLAEYPTVRGAARATGASHPEISKVCRGKMKTTGGFCWRYADTGTAAPG